MNPLRALEIKTFILFNLDFASNTILWYFFFFLPIIDIYFLNNTVIARIFNTFTKLTIAIGVSSKEGKAEIKIHPVIVEAEIRKCLI